MKSIFQNHGGDPVDVPRLTVNGGKGSGWFAEDGHVPGGSAAAKEKVKEWRDRTKSGSAPASATAASSGPKGKAAVEASQRAKSSGAAADHSKASAAHKEALKEATTSSAKQYHEQEAQWHEKHAGTGKSSGEKFSDHLNKSFGKSFKR